ncbi:MAG: GEVED domain-containing protein [Hyphomicrobiales bacterium]
MKQYLSIYSLLLLLIFGGISSAQAQEYCESTSTTDDVSSFASFTNVKFLDINNPSEATKYGDYTSLVANTSAGDSFDVEVTWNALDAADPVGIYIDWNQDKTFSEDELFKQTSRDEGSAKSIFKIDVPNDAKAGNTRLRIVSNQTDDYALSQDDITPCGEYYGGETEDYTINVVEAGSSYCESTVSEKDWTYFSNVKFLEIDNTSEDLNYSDYTSLIANTTQGGSFVLEATCSGPEQENHPGGVYIDWNQDKTFSENELTTALVDLSNGKYLFNINVPENAAIGQTRLRVITIQNSNFDLTSADLTPCGNHHAGETEDYTINVININPKYSVDKNFVSLNEEIVFTNESTGDIDTYEWDFGAGATPATATGIGPHNVSYSTAGTKTPKLTVKKGSIEYSYVIENLSVTTGSAGFDIPNYPYLRVENNDVNIHWFAPNEAASFDKIEGFEGDVFPPAGWHTMYSETVEEDPQEVSPSNTAWARYDDQPYLKDGEYSAYIVNTSKGCNWLATPRFMVKENAKLTFDLYFANSGISKSKFDIIAITDGERESLLSLDGDAENNTWKNLVEIDLSKYVGQAIEVAFVYTYTDGFSVAIDNIQVKGTDTEVADTRTEDAITGYKVYRDFTLVGTVGADKRTYKDTGLEIGTYNYTVAALYGENESYPSYELEATTKKVEINVVSSVEKTAPNTEVTFTINTVGTAKDITLDFGDDATPRNVTGKGPHKIKYTNLGFKNVSVTESGEEYGTIENIVEIQPGVEGKILPKRLTTKAEFNNVKLSWRPADVFYKLEEGFEITKGVDPVFPPENWTLKTSGTINGSLRDVPFGSISWMHNSKNDFNNGGQKFIHWGERSAAIHHEAQGCQWLITPNISVEEGDILNFWLYYNNGEIGSEYYYSDFRVMIHTTKGWEEALHYTKDDKVNHYDEEVVIDLNKYSNQTINVAFVYEHSYGFIAGIDDVAIFNPASTLGRVAGYNIYKDNNLLTTIDDAKATSYLDEGIETAIYDYIITTIDKDGVESFPSNHESIQAFKLYQLPFEQDFEESYTNLVLSGAERSWSIGNKDAHDNDSYTFPDNAGTYAAINASEFGSKICSDYMILSPVQLDAYWEPYIEFDYVSGLHAFQLEGREGFEGKWTVIEKFDKVEDWTHKKVSIPEDMKAEGYQFAFFASNASLPGTGVAVDNIKVGHKEGKIIRLSYKDNYIDPAGTLMFGTTEKEIKKEYSLYIKNVNSEDVEISDVQISGEGFKLKSAIENTTLKAGEAKEVVIEFDPQEENSYSGKVTVNNNSETANYEIDINAICGKVDWTYMVYLYEDKTGLNGINDINELEVNGSVAGKINYIVLYDADDDKKDGIYYIEKDPSGMNQDIISPIINREMNEGLNMNSYKTLEEFILWCKENYPADRYGLNVWDHGTGIFSDSDRSAVGSMDMWEMSWALKAFKEKDDVGLDILGFDVCLASQIETVHQFRDFTKVVIASEKTIPGNGWDYTSQFQKLNEDSSIDTYDLSDHFVTSFVDSYKEGGSQAEGATSNEVTLAAVRTDKFVSEFIPEFNDYAALLITKIVDHKVKLQETIDNASFYGGNTYKEHKDLGHWLTLIEESDLPEELKTGATSLKEKYNASIVNFKQNLCPNATGMKLWIVPSISKSQNIGTYLSVTTHLDMSLTNWDEFLFAYDKPKAHGDPEPDLYLLSTNKIKAGGAVRFINASTGNPIITSRKIEFEPSEGIEFLNGTNENSVECVVRFNNPGKYDIKTTAINAVQGIIGTIKGGVVVEGYLFPSTKLYKNIKEGERELKLVWQKPTDPGATHCGYRIFKDGEVIFTANNVDLLQYDDYLEDNKLHKYYVTCLYTNPDKESEPSNTVEVMYTGLEEGKELSRNVYPNPSNGNINIKVDEVRNYTWQLFSIEGKVVMSGSFYGNSTFISVVQKGAYTLKLQSKEETKNYKVIVQ